MIAADGIFSLLFADYSHQCLFVPVFLLFPHVSHSCRDPTKKIPHPVDIPSPGPPYSALYTLPPTLTQHGV